MSKNAKKSHKEVPQFQVDPRVSEDPLEAPFSDLADALVRAYEVTGCPTSAWDDAWKRYRQPVMKQMRVLWNGDDVIAYKRVQAMREAWECHSRANSRTSQGSTMLVRARHLRVIARTCSDLHDVEGLLLTSYDRTRDPQLVRENVQSRGDAVIQGRLLAITHDVDVASEARVRFYEKCGTAKFIESFSKFDKSLPLGDRVNRKLKNLVTAVERKERRRTTRLRGDSPLGRVPAQSG